MSQSPNDEQTMASDDWMRSRVELSDMIRQGRSFSGHERNCLFLNTGQTRFATASGVSGLDFPDDGRAVATVDWDHDGDLDLWIANRNAPRIRFLRNNANPFHSYLSIRLVGDGQDTNRDAIGARVEVHFKDNDQRPLIRTVRAGEGFISQSSKWLHFGLGREREIKHLVVRWPAGKRELFSGVALNRRYVIDQSKSRLRRLPVAHRELAITPSALQLPVPKASVALRLFTKVPMPTGTYRQFDGSEQSIQTKGRRPLLLVVWASWCKPCLDELRRIAERWNELRRADLQVLALAIDGVGTDPSSAAQARQVVEEQKYPFRVGFAHSDLLDLLQELHDNLVFARRPLPIPCSFLVDSVGQLTAIYKGPVDLGRVLADAKLPPDLYAERWERSACIPGRAIDHPRVRHAAAHAETRTRYRVASRLLAQGRLDDAAAGFSAIIDADPLCGDAHAQLASICLVRGQTAEAEYHADRALSLDPSLATAHNTRGNLYARRNRLDDACESYNRALSLHAEYAEAHNNLGTVHARQGKLALAEKHFRRAIEIDVRFAEAYNNLGRLLVQQGRNVQASQQFANAIQLDPDYAEAHNNLGTLYAIRKNWEKAIRNYERALEIDAEYTEARRNLRLARRNRDAR